MSTQRVRRIARVMMDQMERGEDIILSEYECELTDEEFDDVMTEVRAYHEYLCNETLAAAKMVHDKNSAEYKRMVADVETERANLRAAFRN